ncbi:MAG: UDP-2,3-diacylglucosamine diphosphatase LpxI domain-containing protein [Syntrophobacteraceae bacterium]
MNTDFNIQHANHRIGLIAGGGQFPLLFAHAAAQAGVEVVAVGFETETNPALSKYVKEFHMLKLGKLNALINTFKSAGITRIAMAGTIDKTSLYARIRPDWRAVKFFNKIRKNNDDHLLRALAEELELEGIRVEPSTIFLPSLLAPEGILTRRKPNRQEQADMAFGWKTAKAFGYIDIGQCLVVKNAAVLAVEGIDGTDVTILRGGRLCREGAVVIKVSKPIQDLRFDVPAVGLDTIETMKRVQARVLVIEAGRTLMFDREKMIDAADAARITIMARRDETVPISEQDYLSRGIEQPTDSATSPAATAAPKPPAILIRSPKADALRVGVVGVGYLGRFHAHKYARLPEANLVGVADVNEAQVRRVSEEVQAPAFMDYRELIGKVDAVSIVTPTPFHFEVAKDFLAAGVHVLLEKPITTTLEEADALVALAQEKGCTLQVGHLERFNSSFQAISPRLDKPMFLEAHRLALFNERGIDVDVVLDLMIHDIDIVLHIVKSSVVNIRAAGVAVLTPLPDIATVRLEFSNGAVANLTASRISVKNQRKLRIFQENCYLSADYADKRAYLVFKEKESDEAGYPQISIEDLEIDERDALEEEVASFLSAVRTGTSPVVDGRAGRKALAIALDISHQIEKQTREKWELSGRAPLESL